MADMKFTSTSSQIKMDRLRELLKAGQLTRVEMAKKLECSSDTIGRYLRQMRNPRHREVRIAHWERNLDGGQPTAFYGYGSEKDAAKPKPYTESQLARRYYQKMKREEPAKYVAYLERAKHRAKVKHRTMKGQPLVPADPMLAWIPRRDIREAA